MPRVVVRKGYRSVPGRRRELLAALQRKDALATEAGWPRGRYLSVESRGPGEPDLEVEFTFESYGEMEQLERGLRERLARAPREVVAGEQEFLLEPSATRYLLLLDEGAASAGTQARRAAQAAPGPAGAPEPAGNPAQRADAAGLPSGARRAASATSAGDSRPASPTPTAGAEAPGSARRASSTTATPTGPAAAAARALAPAAPSDSGRGSGLGRPPNRPPARADSPVSGAVEGAVEPDEQPWLDAQSGGSDEWEGDEDLSGEFEPVEEFGTPPPPEFPGMTADEARATQLARARAALSQAEASTSVAPRGRANSGSSRTRDEGAA